MIVICDPNVWRINSQVSGNMIYDHCKYFFIELSEITFRVLSNHYELW